MRSTPSLLIALLLACTAAFATARTFTGTNGKEIVAEIVSATRTEVELKTPVGKTYKVALRNLSKADQLHIAVWRENQEKKKSMRGAKLSTLMEANGCPYVNIGAAGGLPAVDLKINGNTVTLVINTTSDRNLLQVSGAEAADLVPEVPAGQQLPANIKGLASVEKVGIGDTELDRKMEFLVVTPEVIAENVRQQAAGYLGYQFLQESGAVIDWVERKLYFPAPVKKDEEEDE